MHEIAEWMAAALGKEHIEPKTAGRYRVNGIRHCFAGISKNRYTLGYEPQIVFEVGLVELAQWLAGQADIAPAADTNTEFSLRGLTV